MAENETAGRFPQLSNAFDPQYLRRIREEDDSPVAMEGELAGPWSLRPGGSAFALFRLWEGFEHRDLPEGVFANREVGLTFLAVATAVGREPLFRIPLEPGPDGYAIDGEGVNVGHLRLFNSEWVQAAHYAACLARSPLSLAALLEAAGPQVQEMVGQILSRSSAGTGDAGRL
ncbi:MAG TPA: hypothetical protein VMW27_12250 [Thermoanaerobaculia bacterium]|nr:hypothetical protein [Thermoanaerobaculia bacterium]